MTKVKICGITNLEDGEYGIRCGADFLGFVFYKKSSRFIAPKEAKKIFERISLPVWKVGVFVNQTRREVERIADDCRLDFLQFHGDETPAYIQKFKNYRVIKAFRIKDRFSFAPLRAYKGVLFLFDTFKQNMFGGTGTCFNWALLERLKRINSPFIVSGGLTPENVGSLIQQIRPFAVDVSSGVEKSPGKKDKQLVRKFIKAVKG